MFDLLDNRKSRIIGGLAVVASITAFFWELFWPYTYQGSIINGQVITGNASSLTVNGPGIIPILLVPVVLSVITFIFAMIQIKVKSIPWIPVVACFVFCFITLASVGMYFIPTATLMGVATLLGPEIRQVKKDKKKEEGTESI